MLMIIPIVFPSAVYFWTNHDFMQRYGEMLPANRRLVNLPASYELASVQEVIRWVMQKYRIPEPLTVLSPTVKDRQKSKWMKCLTRYENYPTFAFLELETIQIPDGVGGMIPCQILIASPELCFMQAAAKCSFLETIRLGYDLCRTYLLDDKSEYGQTHSNPPVSTDMLRAFLSRMEGRRGCRDARRALKYVRDCSNSPMETRLAIVQTLPFVLGGFSIDGQELNGKVFFSEQAASIFRRNKCSCDSIWRDKKVAMEYDSNKTHLTPEQHDWDKRKATALMADGYKVFSVTSNMVATLQDLEKTFITLRSILGKRTDLKRIEATRNERRKLIQAIKMPCWWEKTD